MTQSLSSNLMTLSKLPTTITTTATTSKKEQHLALATSHRTVTSNSSQHFLTTLPNPLTNNPNPHPSPLS
ncbi:hypothetical protein ASPTUDRAFT_39068 [Aspergillus tubingensis CBS 134.48]|uniref:Uncharacterized protein n=1 Tax=Aspergillus tubingensis (strain CBS 134.48) TaxID=767770 RepID=A0A1L9NAE3_ASPTC|nr:hypothetical protein ASPTUDRAFT_39068 [Aspergillus tubingensis CBS 134.48]